MVQNKPNIIFTIGHSTSPIEDFVQLLKENRITCVIDVRTIPRSMHNPQFNRDSLPDTLIKSNVGYQHMEGLGGLRHSQLDSPNSGWHNASFRGFADYMQTPEFTRNLEFVISLAQKEIIVLMCAEALPWRCHRSLISDALVIRGIAVEHIFSHNNRRNHILTLWAHVKGNIVTYPSADIGQV
jgi:uncharacterized protein (DUF488 family)